jgi:cytochrome P450
VSVVDASYPVLAGPIPPERPLSFFETLSRIGGNQYALFPRAAYEQPIYLMKGPLGRTLLVHDPAGVRQVLLDNVANYPKTEQERRALGALVGDGILVSEGDTWRTHRRIMAPAFDPRSIQAYAPLIVRETEAFLAGWDVKPRASAFDVSAEMSDVTFRIISRTMFSTDSDDVAGLMSATFLRARKMMNFGVADVLPVIGPMRFRAREQALRANAAELDAWIERFVDLRRLDADEGPNDLLARLVTARDEHTGRALTTPEIRDEVLTIFAAGHDTTAVAMTFVWYLLSQFPDHEARLHAELEAVLAGRAPSFDDLPKLVYTRQVIEEAMRLYPPAPGLSIRRAIGEDEICGAPVAKGALVMIVPWILHRHRTLWDEPERFDPDRFSPERGGNRPRFAYLPFGAGPRICIGMQLALVETTILLAAIAQRYRLRLEPGHVVELMPRVTLGTRYGMRMILERR